MALTELRLREVLQAWLEAPGEQMCKLFRTDGIVQIDPIQQLYANWYRPKPYEFVTSTDHEADFAMINDYIQDHQTAYVEHIQECHNGVYDTLLQAGCSLGCKPEGQSLDNCICTFVRVIHTALVEHSNSLRLNVLALGTNSEICERIREEYAIYVNGVVVLENHLPALSEILGNIKADEYRFSLWKFLHQEFVDLVIIPLLSQLMDGVSSKLKACRRHAIEPALSGSYASRQYQHQRQNVDWTKYETLAELKSILTMLVNADIDERSVHTLESSQGELGQFYRLFEEQLQELTQELYHEYKQILDLGGDWKVAIASDCGILDKLLKPHSIKAALDTCLHTAQDLWQVDEALFSHDYAATHLHDVDVDLYYHKLVSSASLTSSL